MAEYESDDALLVFEVRGLVGKPETSPFQFKVANEFCMTEGMSVVQCAKNLAFGIRRKNVNHLRNNV